MESALLFSLSSVSALMSFNEIPGGVTAPSGFVAGSAYCGIKATNADRPDMALIHSPHPTTAAGTFTTNRVKAAPVRVSMMNARSADVRARMHAPE
jgi:glutamate N-acetyltransferase / amino-acid N-acetyltransferase